MTQKSAKRPRNKPELPFDDCVSIENPTVYFQIQKTLQEMGIVLIDLDTGNVINGQVYLTKIGLINPQKPRPVKRRMGFVQSPGTEINDYSGFDVDAVLIFQEASSSSENPYLFLLSVVDNIEVNSWSKVAHHLCQQFAIKVKRKLIPTVTIKVGGLCVPDTQDPGSAKNAMLRKFQKYGFEESHAVSNILIPHGSYHRGKDDDD